MGTQTQASIEVCRLYREDPRAGLDRRPPVSENDESEPAPPNSENVDEICRQRIGCTCERCVNWAGEINAAAMRPPIR